VPKPSRWSQGEKDDPTGRTPPPLSADGHLPGPGGDPPLRQWFVGLGEEVAGLTALGAGGTLVRGGAGPGLGVEMLLKEPGTQVLPQFAGALLPLVEADELILGFGTEHEVKGGSGVAEPALAEFLAVGLGTGVRIIHGDASQWSCRQTPEAGYPIPTARPQERDCTRSRGLTCFRFRFVR
jgi:hypothetical protein